MRKKSITIMITILMVVGMIFSAPPTMEKNIEIMESILNKIIVEDSPIIFSYGNNFHGNYYENFGIILDAESSGILDFKDQISYAFSDSKLLLNLDEKGKDLFTDMDKKERNKVIDKRKNEFQEQKLETEKKIKENIESVKTSLEDFFLNYARSAIDMNDNDKILVNIKIKTRSYDKTSDVPTSIQMSANVSDLKKYYSGKLNEDKMKSKLVYETTTQENQKKDIEVMQNIFDTFLEKESELWNSGNESDGFYLNGFGAVFNIPVPLTKGIMPISINFKILEDKLSKSAKMIEVQAKQIEEKVKKMELIHKNKGSDDDTKVTFHADSIDMDVNVTVDSDGNESIVMFGDTKFDEAKADSIMNKTKDDVIKTLSIYGSTLKSVKSNEKININLKLDAFKNKKSMSLTCSKKDIEDYTNGKIDYEKFVSKFKIK